jgi:protein-S-isoprenylcysteine O-methyltransferase Ste14
MKTYLIALKAVIYMTLFVTFFTLLALWVRAFDPVMGIALSAWVRVPGLVLMAAGGIVGLACAWTFVARGQGTPAPFDAPRKFVAIGPYRFVRIARLRLLATQKPQGRKAGHALQLLLP